MELRGFDSYPVMLGDEMRGERASLGKSLEDAERDLRIKARQIVAIENCDLEGFPNKGVVPGYVRSYARYLGMDPEDCYHRFCHESGFQSPATLMLGGGASGRGQPPVRGFGAELARSRFAAPPMRNRFQARVSLGALTSTAALLGLIAGLSYGGYALLQDIQRVGFAPLPEAPTVVAEAPLIAAPAIDEVVALPNASDYQGGGIFAAVAMPVQLQPVEHLRRDGPISAINPQTAGVFVREHEEPPPSAEPAPRIDSADDAIRLAKLGHAASVEPASEPELPPVAEIATQPEPALTAVTLHAAEDAWIRVRERDNVIFEGILAAGQHYELPPRTAAPILRAGNAGGLFVFVDGVAYGPLGPRGQIARDVSLLADDVRQKMPQAASDTLEAVLATVVHQRAEASGPAPRP
jgi:cytoskeleton protein RodZ